MSDDTKSPDELKIDELWPGVSTPLRPLLLAFQKAPFAIAPERQQELAALFRKLGIFGEVITDDPTFWAYASVLLRRVQVSLPSMERLWAYCYGAAHIWNEFEKAKGQAPDKVSPDMMEGPRVLNLLDWASTVKSGTAGKWPDNFPRPDGTNADPETIKLAEEIFFGSVAFILLHEVGHIVCEHLHDYETPQERIIASEFEADEWAYDWIMNQWRSFKDEPSHYVSRSVRVAIILAILACVEFHGTREVAKLSHPNPIDRLLRFLIKHANEANGLPWCYAWFYSSKVIDLHLFDKGTYDAQRQWNSSREFLTAVRHYFDKTVSPSAPA